MRGLSWALSCVVVVGVGCSGTPPTAPSATSSPLTVNSLLAATAAGSPAGAAGTLIGRFDGAVVADASAARAPGAPTNLVATVNGTMVTLTWLPAAGNPTSYAIQAGSAPGLADLANFDTGGPGTAFVGNAPVGTYFVRVLAVDAQGVSGPSNEVQVVVIPASAPLAFDAPANLAGAVGVPFAFSFCQPVPAGAADLCPGGNGTPVNPSGGQPPYHFQLGSGVGFLPFGINLALNGLLTGVPSVAGVRTFEIQAVDLAGHFVSRTVTMTIAGCTGPPAFAPSNVTAAVNGNNVTVTWGASPGADSYDVEVGSAPGASDIASFNTGNAGTTLTETAPNGTYYVRLRGVNACGKTVVSTEVKIQVGQDTYIGPFKGTGPITRPVPAGGTCTWTTTFEGSLSLTLSPAGGSVRAVGTRSAPLGTASQANVFCLPFQSAFDDTQPVIVTGTTITGNLLLGAVYATAFTGTLGGTVNGTLDVQVVGGTGRVVIPVVLTKQ